MNESGFIQAIHKKLPKEIYRWKVSDRYTSGVADAYYSSQKQDIWIEYKWYKEKLPRHTKPNISELQRKWLNERNDEGRQVFVVVGTPKDCLVFKNKEWNSTKPNSEAITREELIAWIVSQLC